MKTKTKISGIKVRANVKSGGLPNCNHSRGGLRVKAGLKAGATTPMRPNHSMIALTVS
jgi:hypothetical protein